MAVKRGKSLEKLLHALDGAKADKAALRPPLDGGFAYRFTIWTPVLDADGQVVFSPADLVLITELLTRRFGGCSATSSDSAPPWGGAWLDETGKTIAEKHMQIVVYSRQTEEASAFFRDLKAVLERAGNQDVVVVERQAVDLMPSGRLH
ncbi:MAG: hypothetical protein U0836_02740 [Pirellulales bacterium]